jgi:5-formyltetrahydrofolate cyclo-ligase
MATTKAELRREIRSARVRRAPDHGEPEDLLAVVRAAGLLHPDGHSEVGAVTIAAYVAAPGEPDTAAIRAAVRAAGGRVLLPIPEPGRTLAWALDDGHYRPAPRLPVPMPTGPAVGTGAGGLVEAGVTLVLAPALAVDRSGGRLGQGGGFYDGVLGVLPPGIEVLVVVHDGEVLPAGSIPRQAHDSAVTRALTAAGIVDLIDG